MTWAKKMSPISPVQRSAKPTSTNRVLQFRTKNPGIVKLHRLKESVNKAKKRLSDDKYNEEIKRREREKKRKQRASKKSKDSDKSEEASSAARVSLPNPVMSPPSCLPMVSPEPEKKTSTPSQIDTNTSHLN